MSDEGRHVGDIRMSQVLTTYGPGSLIDFPRDAAIMAGLNHWPRKSRREVVELRLKRKLALALGVPSLRLIEPPAAEGMPWERGPRIKAFRFPNWFLAEITKGGDSGEKEDVRTRRLIPRSYLDEKLRYEGRRVVPVRFVAACPKGHVSDVRWHEVLPCEDRKRCKGKPLFMDERGSGGDLADLVVRCQCGAQVSMADLSDQSNRLLGTCQGRRPWLRGYHEKCDVPARLLIRTASNAYFAQTMSVLSLPETRSPLATAVELHWESAAKELESVAEVPMSRKFNQAWREDTEGFSDAEIFEAVEAHRQGAGPDVSVKAAELESILAAPVGYLEDLPPHEDFLARRLPNDKWRESGEWPQVAGVVQLHRLREVTALLGFTRFEAPTPDISGEYQGDVKVAALADTPKDFPAVENRGEGIFVELDKDRVNSWAESKAVRARREQLEKGYVLWKEQRKSGPDFPGVRYILLHTLSHLLIESMAMTCGYPATSIRERIYAEDKGYGILLFTSSPDAEGTLGGLVSQAKHLRRHLDRALREAELCSNDPICSHHDPGRSFEQRFLHGASCHGCSLIAETSCEMRNDFLDRALVVPVLGERNAAFFRGSR